MPARTRAWIAAVLVAALLATGCGPTDDSDERDVVPTLVGTTTIVADIARNIAGDAATVRSLVPIGVDPRTYEPTPEDRELLVSSDLILTIGADYEEEAQPAIGEARDEGVEVIELSSELELRDFEGSGAPEDGDDVETVPDPYFWMDPQLTSELLPTLAEQLAQVSVSLAEEETLDRSDAYLDQLREVDAEMSETLDEVPEDRRVLITDTEGLAYFAESYGFELIDVGSRGRTPGAPLTTPELAALDEAVSERDVPVVFIRQLEGSRVARQIEEAATGELTVVELWVDSLGSPDGPAATYLDLLRTDAELVHDALGPADD